MDPTEHKCVDFIEIRRILRLFGGPWMCLFRVNTVWTRVQGWGRVSQARCLLKALSELKFTLHIYVHQALVDFSCSCCLCSGVEGCQVTWCWGAILSRSSELLTLRQRPVATILLQGLSRISAQWTAWSRHSCLLRVGRPHLLYLMKDLGSRLWCKLTHGPWGTDGCLGSLHITDNNLLLALSWQVWVFSCWHPGSDTS